MATATGADTLKGSGRTQCSQEVLEAIYGSKSASKAAGHGKAVKYDDSLKNWWAEYAARKNDEEGEHVADSLLYDERCHLPRSAPAPVFLAKPYANSGAKGDAPTAADASAQAPNAQS